MLKLLDVSSDFAGGNIKYESTTAGCGAAQLKLGLRYEEVDSKGYYTDFNLLEISSADDQLKTSITSGATKLYVNDNTVYTSSYSPEAQMLYLWDGSTLTMRIPVTGTGSDGGGAYITVGAPLSGGGNPTTIPAYAAGTAIGRRRYCGQIIKRSRTNLNDPLQSVISCSGLINRLSDANGTFTMTASANVDIGPAIYQVLQQFASYWPEFTIAPGNFPTVGNVASGTWQQASPMRVIGDMIGQAANSNTLVFNGDLWVIFVGHDRTPRLVKLYTASTNTYTYNVTLAQGVNAFEPLNVKNDDQDASQLFNRVLVNGDTDPVTKQPVQAIVQDQASHDLYQRWIDATPVTNVACKTVAQCQALGQALLSQNSLGRSNVQLQVYTDEPAVGPHGLYKGDVVLGIHNVTVTRFQGTGACKNRVPDSELQYASGGVGSLWTNSGLTFASGAGPNGSNAWTFTGTGAASGNKFAYSPYFDVVPGQPFTLSCYVDARHVTSGQIGFKLYDSALSTLIGTVLQTSGTVSRISTSSPIIIPAGVAKVVAVPHTNNATIASGTLAVWSQPQIEYGGNPATSYVPNYAAPNVYGLVASAVTTMDSQGYHQQDVKFSAIEPDWNAAMSERANALASALQANTMTQAANDQYIVSPQAYQYDTAGNLNLSTSGLVVTVPQFVAQFAISSVPQACGGNTFTLNASATNWVWLNSGNTWT
ncbi:MAG: hypothetical protein ACXVOI_08960, partial [Tumebacillaceae bacterium]